MDQKPQVHPLSTIRDTGNLEAIWNALSISLGVLGRPGNYIPKREFCSALET